MTTTWKDINAAIKRAFKDRPGWQPVTTGRQGSFVFVQFHGDVPVSLAHDVGKWMEDNHAGLWSDRQRLQRFLTFHAGNALINWVEV